ncbi:hypothetical protein BRC84_01085 [Halobacteriales archaeon QS_1_68_44]|nr:MAG: hypothetical protein BRC84_01085 [Halobacteriales archaeon QS_1_68_44]
MHDRSLDEFADGNAGGDDDPTDTSAERAERATAPDVGAEWPADGDEAGDAEGAAVTYEWTPGGAACGVCGASVETRWRDGEAFVCADCKEW